MKLKLEKSGKKRILAFHLLPILALSVLITAVYSQDKTMSEKDKMKLIQQHYTDAIKYFSTGDYAKAIRYWEEILKLDPAQTQPRKLIPAARTKLQDKNKILLIELKKSYIVGKYEDALEKISRLVENDPSNSYLTDLSDLLQNVTDNIGNRPGDDKTSRYIRTAIANLIETPDKIRKTFNILIYLSQITKDTGIKEFLKYLAKNNPVEYSSIQIIPGVDLLEQKIVATLNYIYDGKYDRAIMECNEVLEIDPVNITAMKRLGSAYYALKKTDKAKQVWQEALKLNPSDKELKSFMK